MTKGVRLTLEENAPAFRQHESFLRYMPIFFKQPDKPLEADVFIVLSPPADIPLRNEPPATLYDLFVSKDIREVPLPKELGEIWQASTKWSFRKIVEGPPLSLFAVAPPPQSNEWQLVIKAAIEPASYTLVESIRVNPANNTATYEQESWRKQACRLGDITGTLSKEYDKILGFVDRRERKDGIPSHMNMPYVVKALLEKAKPAMKPNDATTLLKDWSPPVGSRESFHPQPKLRDWQNHLRARIADWGSPFGMWQLARYEESKERRPCNEDPGRFVREKPEVPKNKDDKDYKRQQDALNKWVIDEKEHTAKKTSWDNWKKGADKHVAEAAQRRDDLLAFLNSPEGQKAPEPDRDALHFLLELDGLVIAKVFNGDDKQLELLLQRVPIAAVFEGTATIDWTVMGLPKPFTVKMANVLPAELLEVQTSEKPEGSDEPPPATPATTPQS
jgi:hypothetical protein